MMSKIIRNLTAIALFGASVFSNGCATTPGITEGLVGKKESVEFAGENDEAFYNLLDNAKDVEREKTYTEEGLVELYLIRTQNQIYTIKEGNPFYHDMNTYMSVAGFKEVNK